MHAGLSAPKGLRNRLRPRTSCFAKGFSQPTFIGNNIAGRGRSYLYKYGQSGLWQGRNRDSPAARVRIASPHGPSPAVLCNCNCHSVSLPGQSPVYIFFFYHARCGVTLALLSRRRRFDRAQCAICYILLSVVGRVSRHLSHLSLYFKTLLQ